MIVLTVHPVARKIAELIEPHLERQGYELIAVEFKQGSRGAMLRLLVDKPGGGIAMNDLERLSPVLSDLLDVYDPIESRYLLEVASPGINRPLLKLEHFEAFRGQRVKIRTHAARNGTSLSSESWWMSVRAESSSKTRPKGIARRLHSMRFMEPITITTLAMAKDKSRRAIASNSRSSAVAKDVNNLRPGEVLCRSI